jgi:hypothetical protein
MRSVIEQDICATCAHLQPSQPLPTDKTKPPFGVFDIQCDCAEGWPRTKVNPSANAISECPKFNSTRGVRACEAPKGSAALKVVLGIESGRKAHRDGQGRDAMQTESERIGWDEAAHDAGVEASDDAQERAIAGQAAGAVAAELRRLLVEECGPEEAHRLIDKAQAAAGVALPEVPQPPEGFRLLPVEATDAMMDADWDVTMSDAHSNGGVSAAAWRAMVEAAPQVTYGNGHSGVGWYMHDTDYPEEGAVFLSATSTPKEPKETDGVAGPALHTNGVQTPMDESKK